MAINKIDNCQIRYIFTLKGQWQQNSNQFFFMFYVKEHEKISRLTIYCDELSLLVLKLFAKIAKYKLLAQPKL